MVHIHTHVSCSNAPSCDDRNIHVYKIYNVLLDNYKIVEQKCHFNNYPPYASLRMAA
jgi:hypothetical protein